MKKSLFILLFIILFACPCLAETNRPEYVEGEVLVVLNAPMSTFSTQGASGANAFSQSLLDQAEAFADEYGLEALSTYSEIASVSGKNIIHLRSEHKSTDELIQELSSAPEVESVSPNSIRRLAAIPNDPGYPNQWGMSNIEMPFVWDRFTGNDTVVVAVLDTGIDYNHPDLNANMARDSYGNYGRYIYKGVQTGDPMDKYGHGTHVAGIIGAVGNNAIGVAGVNWRVKLLAVNFMPNGGGDLSDEIVGMNYILSEKNKGLNIRAVNMSFGGSDDLLPDNSPEGTALKSLSDAGIICVMAAGNIVTDLNNPINARNYPACFRFANTITVGAIGNNSEISVWTFYGGSAFGSGWVDIAAPGTNIYSTFPGNNYISMRGTSMAAPHVAGAAALLCAAYPNESATQIKSRILNGAKKIGVAERYWGSGILDVMGAYSAIPTITTSALPRGAIGANYNQTLGASGVAPMTWTISSGSLPNGLSLNATAGLISGTPTTAGTSNFTVRAQNAAGSSTKAMTIIINPVGAPIITTTALYEGIVRMVYNQSLTATGTTPITWSIASGSLPVDLSLNASTGLISGTPTTAGTSSFTVRATNTAGIDEKQMNIVVASSRTEPLQTTIRLPRGETGEAYSHYLKAVGSTPITWSIASGNLPVGLSLDASTGLISGTPTTAGTFNFRVRAANIVGNNEVGNTIVVVSSRTAPIITTDSFPKAEVGKAYRQYLDANGPEPITWSIASGNLPVGLSLNASTGLISGTPTTIGTSHFTVRAENMYGYNTRQLSIEVIKAIDRAPGIYINYLPEGTVGVIYGQYLDAIGTEPITWSITSGSLPAGLSLTESTGLISGTPTTAGTSNFTVRATNAAGSDTKQFSIVVASGGGTAPVITTASLPGGEVGKAYNQYLAATGTEPITWSIASGSLPIGLILIPNIGVISGTPTMTGTSNFTVRATNAAGSNIKQFSIVVASGGGTAPIIETVFLPDGIVGRPYSQRLLVSGTTPITWSIASGSLPAGLSLKESTGTTYISGTPTTMGTFNFTIRATNVAGDATKPMSIVITELPTITTVSLPGGELGKAYSQSLAATGTPPITWAIVSGSLPAGLSLTESTGLISGTPTALGTSSFSVRATNAFGNATRTLSIAITALPTITAVSLSEGVVGKTYNQRLTATGTTPITWSIISESLPSGLSLNETTGAITGTPTTPGVFSFAVRASNIVGEARKPLIIIITALPVITTESLPGGEAGKAYSQNLAATGSTPITWSISSGALPAGLSLNANTGLISGTPTTLVTSRFSVRATNTAGNATKALSIAITTIPTITTVSLPEAIVGKTYNQRLTATGTTPITWAIASGSLPAGLSLNETSGAITGTPTTMGSSSFTVRATNTTGNITKPLNIIIAALPVIATESLPGGEVGKTYSQSLAATGSTPITWSISSGALPVGLSLNTNTGLISGTPTTLVTSRFSVRATNAAGNATKALSIAITTIPTITTVSLPGGIVGKTYNQRLAATGTTPITWSILSGSLPAGLSLNETSGVITGTPTTMGTSSFTVRATNTTGNITKPLNIIIAAPPVITTVSLPGGEVGKAYSQNLAATGSMPITWSISSGALPAGLSLNASTGLISGTPTTLVTSRFSVRATNAAGNATKALSIAITTIPTITTDSLPGGIVGKTYNQRLTATGTTPITWAIASGSLPAGLSLNTTSGAITGTPTTMGTSSFTIRATNVAGNITKAFSIVIMALPVITTATLPGGEVGKAYSQNLAATGSTPITWSISSGALPAGLSLNANTGLISGTPTTLGTSKFSVRATNVAGNATKALSIAITVIPTITTISLTEGVVGKTYNQRLTATGTTPITWAIANGSLPAGLSLNETSGAITGTPTMMGTYSFTVRATNTTGNSTKALSIVVRQ